MQQKKYEQNSVLYKIQKFVSGWSYQTKILSIKNT